MFQSHKCTMNKGSNFTFIRLMNFLNEIVKLSQETVAFCWSAGKVYPHSQDSIMYMENDLNFER